MRTLAVAAVALLALSGCLGLFDDRPDYDAAEKAVTEAAEASLTLEHDHFDPALHGGAHNLELVGYHNGVDDSGNASAIPAGGYFTELALGERYVYMAGASTGGFQDGAGALGGFSIISAEDPTDPYLVGRYDGPTGSDIEVNADETLAFFGTQRNTIEEVLGVLAGTQDPTAALPRGIHVVDISDKRLPTLESFVPLPYNGIHTVDYVQHPLTGAEYLVACTYDFYGNTVPSSTGSAANSGFPDGVNPLTQRVIVFEIQENPIGTPRIDLVPVSQYQIPEEAPDGHYFMPHDTSVAMHPDGRPLLLVAYWDKGVRILDFSDPAQLTELSGYTDYTPSDFGNIHQVKAFPELIDGRHVTVAEPEIIDAGDETGQMTFIDTTDPEAPTKISHWTLPSEELFVRSLDFSPHNFDLWDGKVALAHYHAGVWVIDVSDAENLEDPKHVAYYIPSMPRDDAPKITPNAWSAFWRDGHIYATDESSGLHILEYTGP